MTTDPGAFTPLTISVSAETAPFAHWAIVELFGHVRCAGYLTEQEIAGHGFLRLEIPTDAGPVTRIVNPKAVYSITPTDEATARTVAALGMPEPVHAWELRAVEAPKPTDVEEEPPW